MTDHAASGSARRDRHAGLPDDRSRRAPLVATRLDIRMKCRCGYRRCTYCKPHRKEPIMSNNHRGKRNPLNWFGIWLAVAMWVLVVINAMGLTPWWVFWGAFTLYAGRLMWLYCRPSAWRTEDSRTTDGDARGEAHRKADHADTRPSWANPDA